MKATFIFCLLAIYGAAADDYRVYADEPNGNVVDSILAKNQQVAEALITATGESYGKLIDLANTTVHAGTDLTKHTITGGTKLASAATQVGTDIAQKAVDKSQKIVGSIFDFVGSIPVVGNVIPTDKMKSVADKGFGLSSKVIDKTNAVAQGSIAFGNNVGQIAVDAVAAGTTKVNDALMTGGQMGSALATNVVTASNNLVSKGFSSLASKLSSFGK